MGASLGFSSRHVQSLWSGCVPKSARIRPSFQRAFSETSFPGSNPGAPATQTGLRGPISRCGRTRDISGTYACYTESLAGTASSCRPKFRLIGRRSLPARFAYPKANARDRFDNGSNGGQTRLHPQSLHQEPRAQTRAEEAVVRNGQKWRVGCEGRISVVKRRHGLDRCRYKGLVGMNRWVGLGVIADNLVNIGHAIEAKSGP